MLYVLIKNIFRLCIVFISAGSLFSMQPINIHDGLLFLDYDLVLFSHKKILEKLGYEVINQSEISMLTSILYEECLCNNNVVLADIVNYKRYIINALAQGDACLAYDLYKSLLRYRDYLWPELAALFYDDTFIEMSGVTGWSCEQMASILTAPAPDIDNQFSYLWLGKSIHERSVDLFNEYLWQHVLFVNQDQPLYLRTDSGEIYQVFFDKEVAQA